MRSLSLDRHTVALPTRREAIQASPRIPVKNVWFPEHQGLTSQRTYLERGDAITVQTLSLEELSPLSHRDFVSVGRTVAIAPPPLSRLDRNLLRVGNLGFYEIAEVNLERRRPAEDLAPRGEGQQGDEAVQIRPA